MRRFISLMLVLLTLSALPAFAEKSASSKDGRIVGQGVRKTRLPFVPKSFLSLEEAISMKPERSRKIEKAAPLATTGDKIMRATTIWEEDWGEAMRPYRIKEYTIGRNKVTGKELVGPGSVTWAIYIGGSDYICGYEVREGNVLYNTVVLRYNMDNLMITDQKSLSGDVMIYTGAYDPISQNVYVLGAVNDGKGTVSQLMIYNPDTYHFSKICDMPMSSVPVIMFDGKGQMYWHELSNGNLYKMDKNNGVKTLVGNTGIQHQYITTGCIDYEDGTCFIANNTDNGAYIYKVDLNSAKSTRIGATPKQAELTGAYMAPLPPEGTAPGEASNIKFNFAKNALSGTITLTAPTKNVNGANLASDDQMTFSLTMRGNEIAQGSATPGQQITIPLTFERPDTYKMELVFSNESGKGKKLILSQWVGYDVPDYMKKPSFTAKKGKFYLNWEHPIALRGEGLNVADMSYKLVRNDGMTYNVGSVTSFEEPYPEGVTLLTGYYYTIYPIYRGFTYKEIESDKAYIGYVLENYKNSLDDEDLAAHFTTEDSNNDKQAWEWNRMYRSYFTGGTSGTVKNDWLFSPGIQMKKGHTYPISFELWRELATYEEKYEVKIGRSPESVAMTEVIAPESALEETFNEVLGTDLWKRYTYTCPEDGVYYVGIHSTSKNGITKIFMDNFQVDYSTVPNTPAAVENLQVIPGALGAISAEVRFNAPAKDISGNPLTTIDNVVIMRDGEKIAELTTNPGQTVSFTDDKVTKGWHSYTVMAKGADTTGPRTTLEGHIGYDIPPMVENLKASVDNYTIINLNWDKVTADVNGLAYGPDMVDYELYIYENPDLRSMGVVKDNKASFQYSMNEQYYFLFAVETHAQDMSSAEFGVTDMVLVGKPYSFPFGDSFADGRAGHPWFVKNLQQMSGNWMMCTEETFSNDLMPMYGMKSADQDNGFIAYEGFFPGEQSMLFCGNIGVTRIGANPCLSFAHLVQQGNENLIDVMIKYPDEEEWHSIATYSLNGEVEMGWKEEYVDLTEYRGKVFQIGFQITIVNSSYAMIDAIRAYARPDYNLRVTAPNNMDAYAGQTNHVSIKVDNNGLKDMDASVLKVEMEGNEPVEYEVPALKVGEQHIINHIFRMSPLAADEEVMTAEITATRDGDASDNVKIINLKTIASEFPEPRTLEAVRQDNGVIDLTWTEPDPEQYPRVGDVEDFESYTDMQISDLGDWTLYDGGELKLDLEPMEWPEINQTPHGFFILDEEEDILLKYADYRAHSGSKYLATVYNVEQKPNDDWLVSPELDGKAKTLDFWCRSALRNWLEDIEVLISNTGKEREDFTIKVLTNYSVPVDWTNVSFDIPEGTKYVAIHCFSNGKGMLMIDDFNLKNGTPVEADFLGYNVYRDGKIINENPVNAMAYSDTEAGDKHSYRVTAVYNIGESRVSNLAYIDVSAVEDVEAAGFEIMTRTGHIVVKGAAEKAISITDASGRRIASFTGTEGIVEKAVDCGIYVVTVDGKSVKVFVK